MTFEKRSIILLALIGVVSIASFIMSIITLMSVKSDNELCGLVYKRILGEVSGDLAAAYRDFDIRMPEHPESFRELIRPLISVSDGSVQMPRSGRGQ